jgi:NAD(P)H-hydrate epimerase
MAYRCGDQFRIVNQWQHLRDHVFGAKKATLSFQAAFTDQLLEGSIRNHESVPAYVPKTLQVSSQNQVTDQIQTDFRSELAAGPARIPYRVFRGVRLGSTCVFRGTNHNREEVGFMLRAFSGAEIRLIDQAAVSELGIPSLLLMENAARGVCERIQQAGIWQSILILAGPGNNGGDGLAVARLLAARGIDATVHLIRAGKCLSADAEQNLHFLNKCGIAVNEPGLENVVQLIARMSDQDLIVDAMLGTGTRGQLRTPFAEIAEAINVSRAMVLAVDVPTGFDCDSGVVREPCVRADWTVTFVALKSGFGNSEASSYAGVIWISDIGIPQKWLVEWSQRSGGSSELNH